MHYLMMICGVPGFLQQVDPWAFHGLKLRSLDQITEGLLYRFAFQEKSFQDRKLLLISLIVKIFIYTLQV